MYIGTIYPKRNTLLRYKRQIKSALDCKNLHHLSEHQKNLVIKLRKAYRLLKEKNKWHVIAAVVEISRSYYYELIAIVRDYGIEHLPKQKRRNSIKHPKPVVDNIIELVHKIRLEHPTYGKMKIGALIRQQHSIIVSDSSVGRALKILKQKGKIPISRSAILSKRGRKFNKHAKRTKYKLPAHAPGDVLQIDHMTKTINGVRIKHFAAVDVYTKYMWTHACSNATSTAAAKFLKKVIDSSLFKIKAIQVDGGSEFMEHFEKACADLKIGLFVLPPRKPQYNGCVERSNRIFLEEFYYNPKACSEHSIMGINNQLQLFVQHYNTIRPHSYFKRAFNLDSIPPLQYIALYAPKD